MFKPTTKTNRNAVKILLFSVCLLCAVSFTVFDFLFAPFGEQGQVVQIPDYCGQRQETLAFPEWLRATVEYRSDSDTAAGTVLSQSPLAGSCRRLTAEAPVCEVTLYVSLGRPYATLPNVIGMDVRVACAQLRGLGFSVATQFCEAPYEEGRVLFTSPDFGTRLPTGQQVTLTVSAGLPQEIVTVPDLAGKSRTDALMLLWASRLNVCEVLEENAPTSVSGQVLRQSHQAGTKVRAGTKITLYVAKQTEAEGTEEAE